MINFEDCQCQLMTDDNDDECDHDRLQSIDNADYDQSSDHQVDV